MDTRRFRGVCFLVSLIGLFAFVLANGPYTAAQTVNGSILGTVKDSQGAAMAGATVTAKSAETGAERTATTDSTGGYNLNGVPAGVYDVSVTSTGFETEIQKGLTLTVGASIRVDFDLKVGSVSQEVEVTGEAPTVNTTNATMGGLVDDTAIRDLPLNARDWLQLALTSTGVATLGQAQVNTGIKMYISGSRATQNVYRVDGFVANDFSNNSPGNALGANMGVDAIREFSVLTNSFSAEYGRTSGGVINAILKSGTNQLHGSGFFFLRNSVLDASNYFTGRTLFRRSQFGSSIGGPIKKDKLFFFADYEGVRQFNPATGSTNTISDDARMGLICPATGTCTSANKIQVVVSPKIIPYLPIFPRPNAGQSGDTGVYALNAGSPGADNYTVGKVDFQPNANNTFSVSYNLDLAHSDTPDNYNDKSGFTTSRNQRVIGSWQHIFNTSLINTARSGVNRIAAVTNGWHNPTVPAVADQSLGWVPGHTMGSFSVTFLSGTFLAGGLDVRGDHFDYTDPQFNDDLSWVKGRNNFRMGFSYEAIGDNVNSPNFPAGQWTFGKMSDFIQAINPTQYNEDIPGSDTFRSFRQKVYGMYFVDDLRLTPRLTVNLGLRYEPATLVSEAYGKIALLQHLTDGPSQVAINQPIYQNPNVRNIAPRIGLAWDPFGDGKTAVRAGFGIYDVLQLPSLYNIRLLRSYPFYNQGIATTALAAGIPASGSTPAVPSCSNGSCLFKGGEQYLNANSKLTFYLQPNPSVPYKMQWNLNIQRQIATGLSLTLGYVGSKGVHLPVAQNDIDAVPLQYVNYVNGHYTFTPPFGTTKYNTNWSRIQALQFFGYSIYHALQVTGTQQLRHGVSFSASYTYSKVMDNSSIEINPTEQPTSMGNPYELIPELQRGVSDYDLTHNMTTNFLWDIPSPHFDSLVPKFLTSGWELTGIYTIRSGTPFSFAIPTDTAGTQQFLSPTVRQGERPDFNGNAPGCGASTPQGALRDPKNPAGYVNMACFPYPQTLTYPTGATAGTAPSIAGQLGNLGRNQMRGPRMQDFDFSIFKNDTVLHEKLKIQFRAEAFNVFNHTNFRSQFTVPYSSAGAPLAAATLNQTFWFGSTVTNARQIQFGLKLIY